ncbi:MAG: HK97 gp10 family phage protein [Candidatus Nanopelagicales bacterium]
MKDPQLLRAYNKIARRLESFLQDRAPVGKTGALKSSIAVTVSEMGIRISSYDYGYYLHLGTGQEASGLTFEQAIGKNYNPNPGEGDNGIKPRFWMSFGQAIWQQVLDEIEAEEGSALAKIIAAQLAPQMGASQPIKVKLK